MLIDNHPPARKRKPLVQIIEKKPNRFCSFFRCIFRFLWCFIKLVWYWFERLFLLVFLVTLTVGLAWWLSQKPSLYRDWDLQDALLPQITWSGNLVTIQNIRDHHWTSDTEFTPHYLTQIFDLDQII